MSAATPKTKNLYNKMEWAGAFGDVGTLIPFVVAYIYGPSRSIAVENLNFDIRDRTGIPYLPSTIIEHPGPVARPLYDPVGFP